MSFRDILSYLDEYRNYIYLNFTYNIIIICAAL